MDITVKSSKLNTGANMTLTKEEAVEYVKAEIEEAAEVFDIQMSANVNLYTEGAQHDPVQKCDITVKLKGETIHQSAHSRSIKTAIDRAIPDLKRQIKRYKTKKIDKNRNISRNAKTRTRVIATEEE